MGYTNWAFTLNGVTVTSTCEHATEDPNCDLGNLIIEGLDQPPDGLDPPDRRTEDVTYFQRDGVRHFNDWYEPRLVTFLGMLGPEEDCESCTTVRQQRAALLSAWGRSCCDIELVIYTPCDGLYDEGDPIPGQQTIRRNLIRNPSFEEDLSFWSVPSNSFCRTYNRCYTGSPKKWCYGHAIDGAFTPSRGTNGGWVGSGYYRLTCVTPPTMAGIGFTYSPATEVTEIDVTTGTPYTGSAYLRASDPMDVVAQILWYDDAGSLLGVSAGETVNVGTGWTRVSVTATAPGSVDHAFIQWVTTETGPWSASDTLDIDGVLFETGSNLLDYFDGDTPDVDPAHSPPQVGDQIVINLWTGNPNLSISVQSSQTYEANLDRSLYGPFGIVGKPRVSKAPWVARKEQIAQFTLRFDGTDQRMYVLDECGTPGYKECRTIMPGVSQTCRSYDLCYSSGGGRCYTDTSSVSLILPVIAPVTGTERVYPLIVLYPGLSYPTIENMTNSEFVRFNGVVSGEPIQIDTENGIATGVITGDSYTEFLGGSIFMSMLPGENQFRMYTNASDDNGSAALCWRPTVVSG